MIQMSKEEENLLAKHFNLDSYVEYKTDKTDTSKNKFKVTEAYLDELIGLFLGDGDGAENNAKD
jgi:hypothetical protein